MRSWEAARAVRRQQLVPKHSIPKIIPEEIYAAAREAGALGIFSDTPERAVAWAKKQPFVDQIILYGVIAALSRCTRRFNQGPNGVKNHLLRVCINNNVRSAKAREFDKLVELLDHKKVGDKLLGECTRFDLLRAAAEAEVQAGELTVDAALYRRLAAIIGNQTVRKAANRGQIVALLTTTYREAAE